MKRIEWLDFAKGISIFMVVLGHTLRGIYTHNLYLNYDKYLVIIADIIFLFAMPVFFALSGYLFKPLNSWREYKFFIRKKAINLLIPYVIFSILYVCLQHIGTAKNLQSWGSLLLIWYRPISYLWFLYTLFFIFVIVGYFSVINISIKKQVIIYLGMFLITQIVSIPSGVSFSLTWIFFFYLGVLCKKYLFILENKVFEISSILICIVLVFVDFNVVGIYADYNFPHLWNFIPKVLIVLISMMCFEHCPRNKIFKYYKKYGVYSLIVYLVHEPVISIVRTLILHVVHPNIVFMFLLLFLSGWYISIFAVYLNKKVKFINMIFSPYKYFKESRIINE